jgi:hypothetical protein
MLDSKLEEEIKNSSKGDCNSYFISCMIWIIVQNNYKYTLIRKQFVKM